MLQLPLARLTCQRIYPTNLLPAGVIITSNNNHRRLLPTDSFGSPQTEAYGCEWSLRPYRGAPSVSLYFHGNCRSDISHRSHVNKFQNFQPGPPAKPLVVVTTNPNVTVTKPAQQNPNVTIKPSNP